MKHLYKSQNKKIAGVCGGLSHYINPELDPIIMRVACLVAIITMPIFLIAYLVLALILPNAPYEII